MPPPGGAGYVGDAGRNLQLQRPSGSGPTSTVSTGRHQVGIRITGLGALDLRSPPDCICFRRAEMLAAAMPEAPVHEYGDLFPAKYYVSVVAKRRGCPAVLHVTQAQRTKRRAKFFLAFRPSTLLSLHTLANSARRRHGCIGPGTLRGASPVTSASCHRGTSSAAPSRAPRQGTRRESSGRQRG